MNLPQPKLNYTVMVEHSSDQWIASVVNWWDCRATGTSQETAIENLKRVIVDRLSNSNIVQIEVDNPAYENPWVALAGKYKDDPDFDAVMEHIAAYRRELDAEQLAEEQDE